MINTRGRDVLGGSRFLAGFQSLLKKLLPRSLTIGDQEVTLQSLSVITAAAVLTNSFLLMGLGRPSSIQGILGRSALLLLGVAGWGIKIDWKGLVRDSVVFRKIEQFLHWAR